MGSSGSGNISDYPGSSNGSGGSQSGGAGGGGGPSDRCERAFTAELEDIEQSEYFQANGKPPPVGEPLQIRQEKRLVAETLTGESVGSLPTVLNYLAACMRDEWVYTGSVTVSSGGSPVASVHADFAAIPPA